MSAPGIQLTDFEPALAGQRTYATRRRKGSLDAALVFAVMLCLLTILPSLLILPSTSADIGRPAVILCALMFAWWIGSRFHPRLAMSGPQPIRWATLIFSLSLLISYAVGFVRGLTTMEANAADRLLLATAAFFGAILMTADGLANWDRLRLVLRVFVWCCAFMSVVGLLQQVLPVDPVQYLQIPGLQSGELIGLQERGGGVRVAATTTHYLELCGTLSLAWPIAIHFATYAESSRRRRQYTLAAILITLGILETISRSGMIAVAIAALVLMPLWTWRKRYNTLVLGVVIFGVLAAASPSLGRTLINLFADASDDPSITSRTERYAMVGYYFSQRPWWGRGTGTWVPPMYQYLDNQWLRTALENGIIGMAALAMLHLVALSLAAIAFRRSSTPEDRHLCLVLVAVQLQALFLAYTFDVMAYSTYTTALGIMIGTCGTVWRFTHPTGQVRTSTTRWFGP
ncbi:O-antigen ligase family protein [Micromonospora sp. DT47]|uniref:O-antigen ligase family protein n=1 Tax=Micromonospora sp. DT47 TaxID=3393431 RepID=UPI003CEC3534